MVLQLPKPEPRQLVEPAIQPVPSRPAPRRTRSSQENDDDDVIVLSKFVKERGIPIIDVNEYVRRPIEERINDKRSKGKENGRACNAFMLYRVCYRKMVSEHLGELKQNNVSAIVGRSWRNEDIEVRDEFSRAAKVEANGHKEAFGDTKYCPQRSKSQTKGRESSTATDGQAHTGKKVISGRVKKASTNLRDPEIAQRLKNRLRERSPEPIYAFSETLEVPHLSYQGTPPTSSISTPAPEELEYQSMFGYLPETFIPSQCGSQPGLVGQGHFAAPIMVPPQGVLHPELSNTAHLTTPMGHGAPYGTSYHYPPPNQPPAVFGPSESTLPMMGGYGIADTSGMQNPEPVRREIISDELGYMDPHDLGDSLDPSLFESRAEEQLDALQLLASDSQAMVSDDFYLQSNDWQASPEDF